jgi:hypothetical protein
MPAVAGISPRMFAGVLRRDRTTPEECQGILSSGPLPFLGSRTVYPARVQSSTTWMRMTAPIHCAAKSGWPCGMILIVKGIQNSCNMGDQRKKDKVRYIFAGCIWLDVFRFGNSAGFCGRDSCFRVIIQDEWARGRDGLPHPGTHRGALPDNKTDNRSSYQEYY